MDNKIYKNSDYHQNSIERLSQEEKDKKQIIKKQPSELDKHNNENIKDINILKQFKEFKKYTFDLEKKINIINDYINKYCKFNEIYTSFKEKIEKQEIFNLENYSFDFLLKNMSDKLKEIEELFEFFDYAKDELSYDYDLFIKQFLNINKNICIENNNKINVIKKHENNFINTNTISEEGEAKDEKQIQKQNILNIWIFINRLYMVKLYYDIQKINVEEKFSLLNKENNLCQSLLINIIDNYFFEGEFFYGLFDYIHFEDTFIIDGDIKIKNEDNRIYDRFNTFHKNLFFYNCNSYSYVYKSVKAKSLMKVYERKEKDNKNKKIIEEKDIIENWNKFIIKEFNQKKLDIIYDIFDYFDINDYKYRKFFYLKIFEMLIQNDNHDLDNIKFINGIISLIENDKCHIFEIFSGNQKEEEEEEKEEFKGKEIFEKLCKKIFEKIEKHFK